MANEWVVYEILKANNDKFRELNKKDLTVWAAMLEPNATRDAIEEGVAEYMLWRQRIAS